MSKTAKEILADIGKLIFKDASEQKVDEQKPDEVKPEAEKSEASAEQESQPEVEAGKENEQAEGEKAPEAQAEKFAAGSIEEQVATLRKQVEVLSDFAMLKQQVEYLAGWVKSQMVTNESYKEAFKQLLPMVEAMTETPTGESVQSPTEGFKAKYAADQKAKKSNWISQIKEARKSEKKK